MITYGRSSWLLNKFSLSAPKESIENSMENMHADIRVWRTKNQELFKFAIIFIILLIDSAVIP